MAGQFPGLSSVSLLVDNVMTREASLTSIESILASAKQQWSGWRNLTFIERAQRLVPLSALFDERAEELAQQITRDMGKPIRQARFEVQRCRDAVPFYCENCPEWFAPEDAYGGKIYHDSLGVVALIAPWNFPLTIPFLVALPALIAGNTIVFKPSEYSPGSGAMLHALFEKVVPGVVQLVQGGKEHGAALVSHPDVAMVALTGSTAAGKQVMRSAADRLCRVSLELGGIDAAIVLPDMDPEIAAASIVAKNCSNAGQICCAAKWAYVPEEGLQAFLTAAVECATALQVGDPFDEATEVGPLVNETQQQRVAALVGDARARGATVHCGGTANGNFYSPTILSGITDDMRIVREECFGPVLPVMAYQSVEEVLERVNAQPYGLTASIWTKDLPRGEAIARALRVGVAQVNNHGTPPIGAPWGGARESGIGRTRSREGAREFTNTKYVRIAVAPTERGCHL